MDLSNLPVVDWDQATKLAGNKKELAEEILDLFVRDLDNEFSKIQSAYNEKNYAEMLRLVHKLHGALCYCGLPRIKTIVGLLETELKNHIMDDSSPLLDQLSTEVNLLLERYPLQQT